jgi:hypothetical protein
MQIGKIMFNTRGIHIEFGIGETRYGTLGIGEIHTSLNCQHTVTANSSAADPRRRTCPSPPCLMQIGKIMFDTRGIRFEFNIGETRHDTLGIGGILTSLNTQGISSTGGTIMHSLLRNLIPRLLQN